MKSICLLSLAALAGLLCGCGSTVNSTRETKLPDSADPLAGIRYYLPKGKIVINALWDKEIPGWNPTITTVIEADPTACYSAKRHVNTFFDDDITLVVDPRTGLLAAANATSTDESINGLGSLIAAAGSALTFGASLGPVSGYGSRGETVPSLDELKASAYSSMLQLTLDTHDRTAVGYLVSPLELGAPAKAAGKKNEHEAASSEPNKQVTYAKFEVSLTPFPSGALPAKDRGTAKTNMPGIVVRVPIPYNVVITGTYYIVDDKGSMREPKQSKSTNNIVLLPDESHDYFLPLNRLPFVTTSTKITLANGMVQSLQVVRPSMINAVAGIPKSLLGALTPIPLQIRQSQANNVQAVNQTLAGEASIKNLQPH